MKVAFLFSVGAVAKLSKYAIATPEEPKFRLASRDTADEENWTEGVAEVVDCAVLAQFFVTAHWASFGFNVHAHPHCYGIIWLTHKVPFIFLFEQSL
jgi:hypothetical protein